MSSAASHRLRFIPPADAGPVLNPDRALDQIRDAWISWAVHRLDETGFAGEVAVALEQSGRELIKMASYPANDG